MSTNNNNSVNPFFGNTFNHFDDSQQHVAEEKLDQFADGMQGQSLLASHQYQCQQRQHQQQQLQRQVFLQQQHQQQQMQQQLQQQLHEQQQHQAQFHSQNVSVNQGLIPLETTMPAAHSLQALMNPSSLFASFGNSNNPFEPSPIVEKTSMNTSLFHHNNMPTNVVSSTPSTFAASQASSTSKSAVGEYPTGINRTKKLLPVNFEPSDKNIICGNKRKYFESRGNIRFRSVCKMFTNDYHSAPTKVEKSAVVSQVMSILREDCPDGGASVFVTPQGGRWYAVSERTSREKVGTFFRDCLADTYKSSAKNKIAKRKQVKQDRTTSSDGSAASSSVHKPAAAAAAAAEAAPAKNNNNKSNNNNNNDDEDGSLGSMSFYDVNDFTPVTL